MDQLKSQNFIYFNNMCLIQIPISSQLLLLIVVDVKQFTF